MYVVEMQNHLIRRVDGVNGVISTVAGTGEPAMAATTALPKQPSFGNRIASL